ncbi:hypothetical protein GCM10019059_42400 [Camelimonas fluminis]|nr:hypothetical protein GCM10019059_42400 [Camelimonas fluminis]
MSNTARMLPGRPIASSRRVTRGYPDGYGEPPATDRVSFPAPRIRASTLEWDWPRTGSASNWNIDANADYEAPPWTRTDIPISGPN